MLLTRRRHLNWSIRCCLLAALLHVSNAAGTAQTLYKSPFPVTQTAEAFSGQPTRVNVRFQFYFPVDNERYLPVSQDLAARLSTWPAVTAEPGLRVRVVTTVCEPVSLQVPVAQGTATVTGGEIASQFEITPDCSVTQGAHEITLNYRAIDLISAYVRARAAVPAEVRITVHVWPSHAAKLEAATPRRRKTSSRGSVGSPRMVRGARATYQETASIPGRCTVDWSFVVLESQMDMARCEPSNWQQEDMSNDGGLCQ